MATAGFHPPKLFVEFRLVRSLGEGAMGQVFLYTDLMLHRPVAVKFLKVAGIDVKQRERCLNEARAIARLTHANVVTVYRVGEIAGVPYIASEFIEGTSLDQLSLPLPFERVFPMAISLARGLSVAHERCVLHRDPWSPKIQRRSGPSYPGRLFCATMQSVCLLARSRMGFEARSRRLENFHNRVTR